MKLGEFGIGLVITAMTFFIGAGLAVRFMPISAALLIGLACWFAAGFGLIGALKGPPAPSSSDLRGARSELGAEDVIKMDLGQLAL